MFRGIIESLGNARAAPAHGYGPHHRRGPPQVSPCSFTERGGHPKMGGHVVGPSATPTLHWPYDIFLLTQDVALGP